MFTQIKAFFGIGLGLSLVVSLLFNYSQFQITKNQALDHQVQGLVQSRDAAQLAADETQRKVLTLRRDALVRVKEVRTVIQHEDCYSQSLPDSVIKRMHYN